MSGQHVRVDEVTSRPSDDVVQIRPGQLSWLNRQVDVWVRDGIVGPSEATAIRSRYAATRRFTLVRLVFGLGATFVGVGLLWFVLSNYRDLSPLVRFVLILVVWLGVTAAAEWLATRAHAVHVLLVGSLRLVSAAAFGGVIYQAATSLQVATYQPYLMGWWALGVLIYAYAVAATAPLAVGVIVGTVWFVGQVSESSDSALGFILAVLTGAAFATAVGILHETRWRPEVADLWRVVGALLVLAGMFAAALPFDNVEDFAWTWWLVVGLALAVVTAGFAGLVADGWARLEALVPLAALAVGGLLVVWHPAGIGLDDVEPSGEVYAHAAVSVLVYLVVAAWYGVLGVLRDAPFLTYIAAGALVVFTTFQSFAVFAPIISGATLFLVVGVVLLVTGVLVDRGRRRLVRSVERGRPS